MEFLLHKKVLIHPISSLSFSLTSGPGRRPSQTVIDQLKATNKSLKLGQRLCRSRSPDFLLEIIQRQVKKISWDRRWPSMIGIVFIWIPCLRKCCKTFNCNCYVTQDNQRSDPPTGHPKPIRFSSWRKFDSVFLVCFCVLVIVSLWTGVQLASFLNAFRSH